MTSAGALRSGKTDRDENFPVASWIIHPRHRALILAFYNFVRTADDIADHAELPEADKLSLLDALERDLLAETGGQPEAVALRSALAARGMAPRHALDVLTAFRMDVTKRRTANWDDLIHYCSFSAMPVGRFMLDVHGESTATWLASDALCAALQINNHLQDCGKDYRDLDRVYLPDDIMARHGADIADLAAPQASPPLLAAISDVARRTQTLLDQGDALAPQVADARLACDIVIIRSFARAILAMLKTRDPLSERVHLSKPAMIGLAAQGAVGELWTRAVGGRASPQPARRA